MPYIDLEARKALDFSHAIPKNAGELNYLFTTSALSTRHTIQGLHVRLRWIIDEYLNDNELRYQRINDVLGALTGAKLEYARRRVASYTDPVCVVFDRVAQRFYEDVAASYEDQKIKENGDVY